MEKEDAQEGIAEDDIVNIPHEWILDKVSVDEEEDGQIDFFPRQDLLLVKAKAFHFGEIGCNLFQSQSIYYRRRRKKDEVSVTLLGVTL
jgi:hypothetical protein